MSDKKSRLVYSSGTKIPGKVNSSKKALQITIPPALQRVSVRLDRKGRGGKSVKLIEGLQMSDNDREILLRQLKTKLGTGGTLKEDILEIQGDQRNAIIALLQGMGYKLRRAVG
jgi:translation initiation factor 1